MTRSAPTSRRTRPAKAALTREGIVTTALALVDELGMEQVSLRRVAQALDTGPASLYVYVADRRELFALAYDRALGEVELPADADGGWRERLVLLIRRTIDVLGRHRGIAAVALGAVPLGENSLRLADETMRLLRVGGLDDASVAWAADLIALVIAAAGLEQSNYLARGADEDVESERTRRDIAAVSAERFPTVAALAPLLTSGDGEARLAWALDVLIDGLLARSAR